MNSENANKSLLENDGDKTNVQVTSSTTASPANLINATAQPNEYTINMPDTVWLLVSTGLVFIMIFGLGIFYSGFVRRKNVLSIYLSTVIATAVVTLQVEPKHHQAWLFFATDYITK